MAARRSELTHLAIARFTMCLVVVFLLFAPCAASRPVTSGWDLSLSTGSSDTTLWRKFSTTAQAIRYHRLLLDLENSRMTQEVATNAIGNGTDRTLPVEDFNTMDYAYPRTNTPGSSDSSTPPSPRL